MWHPCHTPPAPVAHQQRPKPGAPTKSAKSASRRRNELENRSVHRPTKKGLERVQHREVGGTDFPDCVNGAGRVDITGPSDVELAATETGGVGDFAEVWRQLRHEQLALADRSGRRHGHWEV